MGLQKLLEGREGRPCSGSTSMQRKYAKEVLSEELGFKSFLKGREGRTCYRQLVSPKGITHENSLDCSMCTDGSAKRRMLDKHSICMHVCVCVGVEVCV